MIRSLLFAALLLCSSSAFALGTEALIYRAPSAISYSYNGLGRAFEDAGATNVDIVFDWPAGTDLGESYRLVVVTPIGGSPDPALGVDLAAFVSEGGGVVLIGEHDRGGEAGNEVAMALGIEARFAFESGFRGCNGLDAAVDHALTRDAPRASVAWGQRIEGGLALYGPEFSMVSLDGTVVLAGDSDLFADASGLGSCSVSDSTRQFYRNLFTDLADDTVGVMPDAGAPDGGTMDAGPSPDASMPMLGGVGDRCEVNEDCSDGLCAALGDDRFCTRRCATDDECPVSFECDEGVGVCSPTPSSGGGGGCSVGDSSAPTLLAFLLLGLRRARRSQVTEKTAD